MLFRVEAAIPRPAGEVWAVLVDIPTIAGCIPGCEDVLERVRLADYSAVLKQKMGPFKVALPASIAVEEVREPSWIKAVARGTDKFTGTRIDVTLRLDLRDTEPGLSLMVAECDMQVAGKLASLGYSVIKKKAEENFAEFRARLLKVLDESASPSAAVKAPPLGPGPPEVLALDPLTAEPTAPELAASEPTAPAHDAPVAPASVLPPV